MRTFPLILSILFGLVAATIPSHAAPRAKAPMARGRASSLDSRRWTSLAQGIGDGEGFGARQVHVHHRQVDLVRLQVRQCLFHRPGAAGHR